MTKRIDELPELTTPSADDLYVIANPSNGDMSKIKHSNAKRLPYIDVRDYGATGDGATNDTAAFVAALAVGRPVLIPTGTYMIDEVSVSADTTIFGVGDSSVIKRRSPPTQQRVFLITGSNISMHDFKVDGNGHTGDWNCALIQCVSVQSNMRFENLSFLDHSGGGIGLWGVSQVTIRGCRAINTGGGAFFISSQGLFVNIYDLDISHNYVDRRGIADDTATGFACRGSDDHTWTLRRVTIANNTVLSGSGVPGLCIEAWATEMTITGNVTDGGMMGISTAGNLEGGHDLTVSGNSTIGAGFCGIELAAGGGRAVCSGNVIQGSGLGTTGISISAAGTDEMNIVGNVITGVTAQGIYLLGTGRCNITGNYIALTTPFPSPQVYGIRLEGLGRGTPLAHANVSGNYLDGKTTVDADSSAINIFNQVGSSDPDVSMAITGNTFVNFTYGVVGYAAGVDFRGTIVGNNVDSSVLLAFSIAAGSGGTVTGVIRSANRGDVPTITGAKGGNAALTSLLSTLAARGLIVDSTT